jgi:hypothetical protein
MPNTSRPVEKKELALVDALIVLDSDFNDLAGNPSVDRLLCRANEGVVGRDKKLFGTPAMSDDNLLPFSFPAVQRKKITVAFHGPVTRSDGVGAECASVCVRLLECHAADV